VTNIPLARKLLEDAQAHVAKAQHYIDEALLLMTRPPPIHKAPRKAEPMTIKKAMAIRRLAKRRPTLTYREIAAKFHVDGGRVSEVLTGKSWNGEVQ